jgi:hypothetical protein
VVLEWITRLEIVAPRRPSRRPPRGARAYRICTLTHTTSLVYDKVAPFWAHLSERHLRYSAHFDTRLHLPDCGTGRSVCLALTLLTW